MIADIDIPFFFVASNETIWNENTVENRKCSIYHLIRMSDQCNWVDFHFIHGTWQKCAFNFHFQVFFLLFSLHFIVNVLVSFYVNAESDGVCVQMGIKVLLSFEWCLNIDGFYWIENKSKLYQPETGKVSFDLFIFVIFTDQLHFVIGLFHVEIYHKTFYYSIWQILLVLIQFVCIFDFAEAWLECYYHSYLLVIHFE